MFKKVSLIVTEACNMRCKYCFEKESDYKNNWMSEDVIKRVVELFFDSRMSYPDKQFELFGGEPLMSKSHVKMICDNLSKYSDSNTILKITSNMMNVDEEMISILKGSGCTIELTGSVIPDEILNDIDRVNINGKGTYTQVMKNIMNIVQNHKDIQMRCHSVFSPKVINHERFEIMVDNMMNLLKNYGLVFSTAPISGETCDEVIYDYETVKKLVSVMNSTFMKHEELLELYTDTEVGSMIGHFNSKTRVYEYTGEMGSSFCNDITDTMLVMYDGSINLCHRMALSGEMDLKPNISVFDDIEDIFNTVKSTVSVIKEKLQVKYNDKMIGHYFKTFSEHDLECSKCIAYHDCHHCFIPYKGDKKNIKPKSICDYARNICEAKMDWESEYCLNDICEVIPLYIEKLNSIKINRTMDVDIIKEVSKRLNTILKMRSVMKL